MTDFKQWKRILVKSADLQGKLLFSMLYVIFLIPVSIVYWLKRKKIIPAWEERVNQKFDFKFARQQ